MIYHGDLFDVLPTLDAASLDACVTDPPYEWGFMAKAWDGRGVAFDVETWRAIYRVLKPGAYLAAFGGTRTSHRMTCAIEDAGFVIRDALVWLYGQGFPKSFDLGNGKGTALKPAHEPIALAWKPFKSSIKACHETHGTAALNIDACRIDTAPVDDYGRSAANVRGTINAHEGFEGKSFAIAERPGDYASGLGRWPANVLLDEEAAELLDAQSGDREVSGAAKQGNTGNPGRCGPGYEPTSWNKPGYPTRLHNDTGGASRFYYVAKPSREERDYGTEGLTARQRDESRKAGNPGGDNPRNRGLQPRGNHHPTVKPVELMRWLVKLVTPINGVVLDPFMGSGTTGMACRYEQRGFIGVEREAEYWAIAERRIAAVAPLFGDSGELEDSSPENPQPHGEA